MNLPNSYFEGFPIEFKKINPEDFPGFEIENDNKKVIIEPNDGGYISDAFQAEIDLRSKNTVVVNAAVGQGKSTAIIRTIGKYYHEHPDTLIIVATPFVSLVEQYCDDIHLETEIPKEHIYNYSRLGKDWQRSYKTKRVQVVTVNTLLGNPGDDAFINSERKREYLSDLLKRCLDYNLKVVFIYDEIHDAIQNFKQELIFSLWKWRNVIIKNYILSATYNEASKVVIKYLAELTNKKIQIIETKRVAKPDKQSKLFLHYSPAYHFSNTTPEIVNVITKLVKSGKDVDILSYSKILAESIINDDKGVGKVLKDAYVNIKNCTSDLNDNQRPIDEPPQNIYDKTMCNIGTNFKTGVSIRKENHAYVIILPPRHTRNGFKKKLGIFSGGINSIIQEIARQRTQGEIHIILPLPDKFNFETLKRAEFTPIQIAEFKNFYNKVSYYKLDNGKEVEYLALNEQDFHIHRFYSEELVKNVSEEISHINSIQESRTNLPMLIFPDYETYKLRRGEEYLATKFKFYGEDIASYVTYSAITNQFVNCRLQKIKHKTILTFKENFICFGLKVAWDKYFGKQYFQGYLSYMNFPLAYTKFRNELFSNYDLKFKREESNTKETITPYQNNKFEEQLLRFIAYKYFGQSYYRAYEFHNGYSDIPYTRSMYLLDCLSVMNIGNEIIPSSENNRDINKLYQILGYFRNKLISEIKEYSSSKHEYNYLKTTPPNEFYNEDDIKLFEEFTSLIKEDHVLDKIYNFRNDLNLKSFYTRLINDFFVTQRKKFPSGSDRIQISVIIEIKPIPESTKIIDLISSPKDFAIPEDNDPYMLETFGSYENYLKEKEEIISLIEGNMF